MSYSYPTILNIRNTWDNSDYVSLGLNAAAINPGTEIIAIGKRAAYNTAGNYSISVGVEAGEVSCGSYSVNIGYQAGETSSGSQSCAIGYLAGNSNQGSQSCAFGYRAGEDTQATLACAFGLDAGRTTQGSRATAFGPYSGTTSQGGFACAFGNSAGNQSQSLYACAFGHLAGATNQGQSALAFGHGSGQTNQGASSIAFGHVAGTTSLAANAIVINATGSALENTTASSFKIAPIRSLANTSNSETMYYDTSTNEVTTRTPTGNSDEKDLTGLSSHDFENIPAGVQEVTVLFNGPVLSAADNLFIQMGHASAFITSGYLGHACSIPNASNPNTLQFNQAFTVRSSGTGKNMYGHMILKRFGIGSNVWLCSYALGTSTAGTVHAGGGRVDVTAELTRIRIRSSSTNTWNSGTARISWRY